MPKVPSQGAPPPSGAASKSYENTLKRNQACHQCRKRKLLSPLSNVTPPPQTLLGGRAEGVLLRRSR
ncbi:hypothetical protein FRC00_006699 [Tulasnella sp. 408]|nr:hypothetical protein FRC00_006699 [Tulasnella sp. 408]